MKSHVLATSVLSSISAWRDVSVNHCTHRHASPHQLFAANNVPDTEMVYLQDFFDATNGNYWTDDPISGIPWDFSADANPCVDNWQGIECVIEDNTYHVSKLVLPSYNLSGSIPDNISELPLLSVLNLQYNSLTSSIPSTIGVLAHMKFLNLLSNKLTGTLPESIGSLLALQEVDVGLNKLHGPVPDSVGNLVNLLYLYLHDNELSGYVPSTLGNLIDLFGLDLGSNMFSGTVPASFLNLSSTLELVVYDNHMTGSLPNNWAGFSSLYYLDWGFNSFTGTIPSSMFVSMEFFYANLNYLSGTIPEAVVNYMQVNELLLSDNFLSGTVPTAVAHLAHLTQLQLEINFLSGNLAGAFNASYQLELNTITLNNNQFTGLVPDELYRMPQLRVLLLAVNCLAVGFTSTMCGSPNISTLSLDGLSASPACRTVILPKIARTYVTKDVRETELPSCVFEMANLQTLHLSATGLKGTLPADVTISPKLSVLSLSHNILVGSIPLNFQSHPWSSLDLSYNKLGGTMDSSLGAGNANLSLYLANNRLSGAVPRSVRDLVHVSVLGSNLLHCDVYRSDLPAHDSESDKYECGSTSFEIPYYIWLCIFGVFTILIVFVVRHRRWWDRHADVDKQVAYVRMWLTVSSGTYGQWKDKIKSVAIVSRVCELLCRTALWCLAYIMLVLMPIYIALSYHYNTMTYLYAYTLSAAYLSGIVPSVMMCLALLGLLALLIAVYVRYLPSYTLAEMQIRLDSRSSRNLSRASQPIAETTVASKFNNALVYLSFGLVNLAVVIGVNYAYINAVVYQSNQILVIAQISIALFKLIWSSSGINALVRMAIGYLVLTDAEVRSRGAETRFIMLQILLTLLNNILIPCVVVAVVSESCYYNVFVSAPDVITYLPYDICTTIVLGECAHHATGFNIFAFTPPYKYDYQCASSIIAIYAPAYITLCIMATFGVPLVELIAHRCHSMSDPQSCVYLLLDYALPRILKPIDVLNEEELQVQAHRCFHVNQLLVMLINLLGLLLTFGAVFPPLAVALSLTLMAVTYYEKLKLGRFLCNAISVCRINYVDLIEAECQRAGAVTVLYRSAWILVVFSCLFYTLFIFDTLGDAVGVSKAFVVLLVLPAMPIVIYLVYFVVDIFRKSAAAPPPELNNTHSSLVWASQVTIELTVLGGSDAVVNREDDATFNALLFSDAHAKSTVVA